MRVVVLSLLFLISLSMIGLNWFGQSEISLKCRADVFTKDGDKISTEDVFLFVTLPNRYAFWNRTGAFSLEVKGLDFRGTAERAYDNVSRILLSPKDSQGFDGSISMLSYAGDLWNWQHFYKLACVPYDTEP